MTFIEINLLINIWRFLAGLSIRLCNFRLNHFFMVRQVCFCFSLYEIAKTYSEIFFHFFRIKFDISSRLVPMRWVLQLYTINFDVTGEVRWGEVRWGEVRWEKGELFAKGWKGPRHKLKNMDCYENSAIIRRKKISLTTFCFCLRQ